MISFNFYKFSPGGNTTVFLVGKPPAGAGHFCREALSEKGVGGEQAGFVDLPLRRLTMAAGEFCANASRALAALLAFKNPDQNCWDAVVSGLAGSVRLEANGKAPVWQTRAIFSIPKLKIDQNRVDLSGISHLYQQTEVFPDNAEARLQGAAVIKANSLHELPAAGHIWWRRRNDLYEILPFVMVPQAGTALVENACGSASLGLAALLNLSSCQILQPSGAILEVSRNENTFGVSGSVSLVCQGEIWLE